MQQLAFPMPRMEIIPTSDGLVVALADTGTPVAMELSPADALSAGIWLLDGFLGRPQKPFEIDGMNVASSLGMAQAASSDGRSTLISVNDGVTIGHLTLSAVQTLLAGEHLVAHAVSAGARLPDRPPAPRAFEAIA